MSTQHTGARRAALSDTKRALLEARLRGAAPAAAANAEGVTRRAGPGPEFPASFAQERMWFLSRFAPGSPMYNIPAGMLVPADVDVPALERALTEVVRRHETLRTTYRMDADGQLVQVVQPASPVGIEVIDVRDRVGGPVSLREERAGRGPGGVATVNEVVAEEGARPFDLERGPMIRLTLLRVSDAEQAMVITTHHIATDGWSMPMVYGDLLSFYEAFREGRPLDLPEPPLRYADYAAWQRERLQGEALETQVRYWRELLDGAPALELPTDRPRPATASNLGRVHHFRLDDRLAARVRETCRTQAATVNMVLLAAFAELLRHWSGQDDLVVGTLLGSRARPELEPIVGMFVNSAALRLRMAPNATFRDAVALAREAVLDASRHQDLPFEKLVDELGVPRDLSRHPVFQVVYFHQPNFAAQGGEDDGRPPALPMRPLDPENESGLVDTGAAKFDLQLTTFQTGEGVGGTIEYATDLFDDGTIERMARHFATLLRAAVQRPDAPLAALPMMAGDERAAVLAMGTGAERRYEDETLHALFARQAARAPAAVALAFEGRTMAYAELDARANQLAHRLRRLGVGPEARVGVCMERGMEMVVALLGVLKAGGAYVPLDPEYPAERLAYMLADAAVPVLLTQPHLANSIPAHGAQTLAIDPAFAAIEGESSAALEDDASEPQAIPCSLFPVPSSLAYAIYTSGSTGNPKGAMNAHRGVVNRLRWMQDEYGLTPDDVVLQKTPFSFDVSVWEFFWPLITGARLVIARPGGHRDAAYLAELIEREGVTTLHFVPSMLAAFVDAAPAERCRTLARVVCSGEALPEELVQRFYARMDAAGNDRVRLHNLYGPTEAAVDVTYWPCERGDTGPVPIGVPVANTRILVLDRRGEPVPVGVPGELHIGGVQVGRGYLGRPALTAEKFVPDPFGEPGSRMYRTGDRVRWMEVRERESAKVRKWNGDADSREDASAHARTFALQFLGRMDFQVKLRGFRIELGEIESLLVRHPSVSAAAAVVRDDGTGPRLVAYVAPREGAAPPAAAGLRAHLQQALPEHMVPAAIAVLDALPLTGSGKVDRRALPAPEDEDAGEELVAPRNVVEEMVAEVWAEVLRRERIGVTQNFFALGGHSLLATQVIVRMADAFDVQVPIVTFFQDPTVAGLAAAIQQIGSPVLEAMVDELAGLSAEEIEALLAEESA